MNLARAVTFEDPKREQIDYYNFDTVLVFDQFNTISENKTDLLGVVSPPRALKNKGNWTQFYTHSSPSPEYLDYTFDLISLYMTALGTDITVTITGGDYFISVIKRVKVLLRANVVTHLPLSGFKKLASVTMTTSGPSNPKYVIDNVVIRKLAAKQK